jgi:hypothetical protein
VRSFAASWLVDFPPLYVATVALVAGDALGNTGVDVPLTLAIVIAVIAAAAYLAARPAAGVALAFVAIAAAATVPVTGLLHPPRGPNTLYRFADDSKVTLEGVLVREPERADGGRTYLHVRVERAGAATTAEPFRRRTAAEATAAVPITSRVRAALALVEGLIRVTIRGDENFTIGDEIRLTSRIRFPRNDGDQGEFDYRGWLLRNGITATMFADEPKPSAPPAIAVIGHRAYPVRARIQAVRERIGTFIDANLT